MKKIILKIFSLLFILNIVLLGNTVEVENKEVSLDSLGLVGIVIMVVFSSLLGAFFLKDELSKT